jgi:uroporphyrin-III C-methyltransferase
MTQDSGPTTRGLVSLVGAGPGDPELISVRGLRRLRAAQVVVYDRLIHPALLDEVSRDAERIFAGKASGRAVMSQRAIESLLIEGARAGKRVVRLKGGDPFLFGRGAEEVEALAAAGVRWEVVPGISSALAVPAAAGIPVTHRELSSAVTVVTGHEDPAKGEVTLDWDWLARAPGTLIVLMGLERIESIASALIAAGRDPATPAAVVSAGTWPQQRTVTAGLGTIAIETADAGLQSPAIIVIGDVCRVPEIVARLGTAALQEAV